MNPPPSGSTATRLLHAAAELLGGEEALARRLGLGASLLERFMSGQKELPAELILRTVDILLEATDSGDPFPGPSSSTPAGNWDA